MVSPGTISDELDLDFSLVIRHIHHGGPLLRGKPDAVVRNRRARMPAPHDQPENEVPHPQDFEAFGFTKTNPCCMSVS